MNPDIFSIVDALDIVGNSRIQKLNNELSQLEAETEASKYLSKTAPDRSRRKNWQAGSINLKTHRGEKIHVKAPGKIHV